jgi:hypothetical protein
MIWGQSKVAREFEFTLLPVSQFSDMGCYACGRATRMSRATSAWRPNGDSKAGADADAQSVFALISALGRQLRAVRLKSARTVRPERLAQLEGFFKKEKETKNG